MPGRELRARRERLDVGCEAAVRRRGLLERGVRHEHGETAGDGGRRRLVHRRVGGDGAGEAHLRQQLRDAAGGGRRREQQHDRGRTGGERGRDRREVGQRGRRRGNRDRGATRNPAARSDARACASRAAPSSLSSTASVTCRPLRGAEQRTQARAPRGADHLGLQRGLRAHEAEAVAVAVPRGGGRRPDERRRRLRERRGVERVADRGHDGEHRRSCGRRIGGVAGVLDGATGHSPASVRAREAGLRADLGADRCRLGADETSDGDGRTGDTDGRGGR